MAKLTMLAALLAKLEGPHKEAFINELSNLISSKTGGLDFKITENDITKTIEPGDGDQEHNDEDNQQQKFAEASKIYGQSGPDKYGGINVQEM
jgi:hypothetical protein